MFDNNLIFSLILSLINTGIFIALTHKENFDQKKQEYIMLFGITFITSFLMRTCMQSGKLFGGGGGGGGIGGNSNVSKLDLFKSSRPPF